MSVVCSTDGRMTVVVDLSMVIPSGEIPRFHLKNEHCQPSEVNGTRVLFSFPVNSCGAIVKVQACICENGVLSVAFSQAFISICTSSNRSLKIMWCIKTRFSTAPTITLLPMMLRRGMCLHLLNFFFSPIKCWSFIMLYCRVTVQCMYPLAGLHRLFSAYAFESDMDGFGSIVHTVQPTAGTIGSLTALPPQIKKQNWNTVLTPLLQVQVPLSPLQDFRLQLLPKKLDCPWPTYLPTIQLFATSRSRVVITLLGGLAKVSGFCYEPLYCNCKMLCFLTVFPCVCRS